MGRPEDAPYARFGRHDRPVDRVGSIGKGRPPLVTLLGRLSLLASLVDGWYLGLSALAGRAAVSHCRWLGTVDWRMAAHNTVPVSGLSPHARPYSRMLGSPSPFRGGLH